MKQYILIKFQGINTKELRQTMCPSYFPVTVVNIFTKKPLRRGKGSFGLLVIVQHRERSRKGIKVET